MTTPLLDNEDLNTINAALQRGDELRQEMEKARLAGIDLGNREQTLIERMDKLRSIKSAFFSED